MGVERSESPLTPSAEGSKASKGRSEYMATMLVSRVGWSVQGWIE